jgi:hypothetical protein
MHGCFHIDLLVILMCHLTCKSLPHSLTFYSVFSITVLLLIVGYTLGLPGRLMENKEVWPGTMAHSCNLSYSEGRDRKDGGLRPAQAKSYQEPPSQPPC